MLSAKKVLAASMDYTDESVAGGGAIKGKNCIVKSITDITGGHEVTFEWTLDNGTVQTGTMDVMDGEDGKGIASVTINAEEHLIITYTDGSTSDAGEIEVQSAVDSVNGQTGEVVLTASDVNALPDNTTLADLSGDSTHRTVTDAEKTAWNAKSDFSGSYDDLTDKPSIPDEISDLNDTAISSPKNGQVMTYDSGKWKNADNNPTITVDSALSTTSENPVQNKVLTAELNKKSEYIEIEWDDYKNLSYAEKHNGKEYLVSKIPGSAVSASGVSYDNTTSGITADNVQDALDEIAAGGGQITVDSAMSTTSTNPLQNKVITLEVQDMRASMLNDELKLSAVELAVSHLQTSMLNIDGAVVDGASYDSTNHLILFKHGSTTLFSLDAAAFVKDGMVDTVTITGGNLVITFNTDAGKQAISIPLTDIFDPANYYDKTATDNLLADKVSKSNTAGLLKNDGTVDTNTYATTSQLPDITGKADKVSGATNGNLAGLDANGNLTDSGKSSSDFGTADEIADIVNVYGSKNLMETTALSHTQNGITKTVNADGSFTLNGTATKNTYFYWMGPTTFPTENIQYTYSIETSAVWGIGQAIAGIDKRSETAYIDRYKSLFADGTTHIEGTFTGESGYYAWAWIFIPNGTQLTDVIVKGMIRMASIKDDTFVPYAKTNGALTIDKAEQAEVNDIVNVLGAKNLIPYPYFDGTSKTNNGITYTVNDDGSITANGTATAGSRFYLISSVSSNMPNGNYIISDGDVGDSSSNVQVALWDDSTYTGVVYITNNGEKAFTLSDTPTRTGTSIYVSVDSGTTVSNLTFYPMLRLASDPDDTYQPYAMTNRELTEKLQSSASVVEVKSLMDSTYVSSCNSCRYCVSNGICYVYINNIKFTSAAVDTTDCLILPTSALPTSRIPATSMAWGSSQIPIFFTVGTSGNMVVNGITSANQNTTWYGVSFSYPVAE